MNAGRGRAPVDESQFPQADSLTRILDVLAASCAGPKVDEAELGRIFGITERQGFYYGNAAAWFGLVYKSGGWIRPTGLGSRINAMDDEGDRFRVLAETVVAKPVFSEAARHLAAFGQTPEPSEITAWVRAEDRKVNDRTAARRADTVIRLLNAISEQSPGVIDALVPERVARFA